MSKLKRGDRVCINKQCPIPIFVGNTGTILGEAPQIGFFTVSVDDGVDVAIHGAQLDVLQDEKKSTTSAVSAQDAEKSTASTTSAQNSQNLPCLQTSEGMCGHAGWRCKNCKRMLNE